MCHRKINIHHALITFRGLGFLIALNSNLTSFSETLEPDQRLGKTRSQGVPQHS